MECPSTVNEMTKSGGDEYKKVWDGADQFKNDRTPNRMVRYFSPAYDGYLGFIDRHGMSVIGEPTEEQYKYLVDNYVGVGDLEEADIRMGAKEYLLTVRNAKEGTEKEEEIRMNPFDEREVFLSSLIGCLYNSFKLNEQLDYLSYTEGLTERGNLVWENGHEFYKQIKHHNGEIENKLSKLIWVANPKGKFEKVVGWLPKESNHVYERNGHFFPSGNYAIRIGCDPFKYDKTKDNRKSDCAAYAYQMPDLLDENNKFNDMFVMRYADRPPTTDIQYENVLKMAWFCGCQALIERNIGESPKKYFQKYKSAGFLMYLPDEVEFGIYTDGTNKVVQTLCDYTESYIERDINKVYFKEQITSWLNFEVGDTQKYDDAMASGFALIAAKQKRYVQMDTYSKSIESIMPYNKAV
jgi:hypothetical protein